jgi:hypothetical protein
MPLPIQEIGNSMPTTTDLNTLYLGGAARQNLFATPIIRSRGRNLSLILV